MSDLVNELEFSVKNLGSLREGSFAPRALTLFCGPNNSGKTWVMYSLYHCYEILNRLHNLEKGETKVETLDKFNKQLTLDLPYVFNVPPVKLSGASFRLNKVDPWSRVMKGWSGHDVFLMPAERNGLHLFFRELSTRRTALLHHASRDNIDIGELLRDVIHSRYALPIARYIDWLNSLGDYTGNRSDGFHEFAERLKKKLAKGAYKVDRNTSNITFKPYQLNRKGEETPTLDLHVASSNVKSLFGLWFYLEHQAEPGDILMIDEPELNVHPENQRKIARLLARLVNAGLRIVISTHSDYIVRELNTLIMLNQTGAEELRRKHQYEDEEILSPDQIAAYLFDQRTIAPFEVTPDDGIYAETFDEVIASLNGTNNDVYYSLQEQKNV